MTCFQEIEEILKNKNGYDKIKTKVMSDGFVVDGKIWTEKYRVLHKKGVEKEITGLSFEKIQDIIDGNLDVSKITRLDFGETKLHEMDGMTAKVLLEVCKKFPNLTHLNFGLTELHNIDGMTVKVFSKICEKFPDLTRLKFGQTRLERIEGMTSQLKEKLEVSNFETTIGHINFN